MKFLVFFLLLAIVGTFADYDFDHDDDRYVYFHRSPLSHVGNFPRFRSVHRQSNARFPYFRTAYVDRDDDDDDYFQRVGTVHVSHSPSTPSFRSVVPYPYASFPSRRVPYAVAPVVVAVPHQRGTTTHDVGDTTQTDHNVDEQVVVTESRSFPETRSAVHTEQHRPVYHGVQEHPSVVVHHAPVFYNARSRQRPMHYSARTHPTVVHRAPVFYNAPRPVDSPAVVHKAPVFYNSPRVASTPLHYSAPVIETPAVSAVAHVVPVQYQASPAITHTQVIRDVESGEYDDFSGSLLRADFDDDDHFDDDDK